MSKPLVIPQETIIPRLFDYGVSTEKFFLTSPEYVLPSREWIATTFAQDWSTFRAQSYPRGFVPGKTVCHHYSQGCAWFAGRQFALTDDAPADTTLLLGEFVYKPSTSSDLHAVCFAFVYDGGDAPIQLIHFEPQDGFIVTPTKEEIQSCVFYRV